MRDGIGLAEQDVGKVSLDQRDVTEDPERMVAAVRRRLGERGTTNGYRVTATFLNYLVQNVDPAIVVKLNVAMRNAKYSPALWQEYTGKSVDALSDDYLKTLAEQR